MKRRVKAYHHRDLPNALVETALHVLERDGAADFTLRSLAREIGVSHNAPYAHFADKQALLGEVARIGFVQLRKTLLEAVSNSAEHFGERLTDIAVAYILFGLEHPAHYRLMFGADLPSDTDLPELHRARTETFACLTDVLAGSHRSDGAESIESTALAQRVGEDAVAAWSFVHGLTMLVIDKRLPRPGYPSDRASIEQMVCRAATRLVIGFRPGVDAATL